jgi:dihydrofolate reductase/thymidylate synthase
MTEEDTLRVQLVVAMDDRRGIARDGALPWALAGDLAFFRVLTTRTRQPGRSNAVVMGRRTWESIPAARRPLPGRVNVVLTRDVAGWRGGGGVVVGGGGGGDDGVVVCGSLLEALTALGRDGADVETAFVVGGAGLYAEALEGEGKAEGVSVTAVHVTHVEGDFGCDVFFPTLDGRRFLASSTGPRQASDAGTRYVHACYENLPVCSEGPNAGGVRARRAERDALDAALDAEKMAMEARHAVRRAAADKRVRDAEARERPEQQQQHSPANVC